MQNSTSIVAGNDQHDNKLGCKNLYVHNLLSTYFNQERTNWSSDEIALKTYKQIKIVGMFTA